MPFQLVRLFRRRKYRAASAATSNVSELAGTSNSNSNDAQAGAFVQILNNTNIGTIHGSLFSNNQIHHHHHHHHPQADDDEDYAEIKVRDIILETELGSGETHHDLQSDGTLVEVGWIRKYTGRLFQQPHESLLIHKYEGQAIIDWKSHFSVLSAVRHPNILQLYGICRARNFTALIFHNVQQTDLEEYHLSLSGPSFITYIADVVDQFQSAINALQGHGLEPEYAHLSSYNVDYAGHLVVDSFESAQTLFQPFLSSLASASDLKILTSTFKHQSLTRSSLVEYYDLLGLVCSVHHSRFSTTMDVSITHKGLTTKLWHPLPYIGRSRWDNEEIAVELEWISGMLRCAIPISQLPDMSVVHVMPIEVQIQKSSGRSSSPLLHVSASQIHHIIRTMKMDASEVLTVVPYYIEFYFGTINSDTPLAYDSLYLWYDLQHPYSENHWWSTDPEGQILISNTEMLEHLESSFDIHIWSYHIPQQIYPILWDIHKACGFDPESTEMAEYLGYPLLEPTDSESMSCGFDTSQEADQPLHSGCESEVESDDGSSSSHETFVSALSED